MSVEPSLAALSNDPDNERPPAGSPVEGPLRALPVEPLNTGGAAADILEEPMEESSPEPRRAIRAIPVAEDKVIEEGVEEP